MEERGVGRGAEPKQRFTFSAFLRLPSWSQLASALAARAPTWSPPLHKGERTEQQTRCVSNRQSHPRSSSESIASSSFALCFRLRL